MRGWVFLILFFSSVALCAPKKVSNFWSFDLGGYMSNVKERLNAPTGYGSRVSTLAGYFRFRRGWHIGKNFSFEPSFGTMIPWRKSTDSLSRMTVSHFDLDFGMPLFSVLRFRTGPGIEWGMMQSAAATVSQSNGSSTSDFYVPERTAHYFLWTAQGGFEVLLSKTFTVCADLMVSNLLSSSRRRYNVALTVGIRL